jgi:hypothetical protein
MDSKFMLLFSLTLVVIEYLALLGFFTTQTLQKYAEPILTSSSRIWHLICSC